jgi:hypothetical protein
MRRVLWVAAACVAALVWTSTAPAEDVQVGLYVNNLGRLDMATGTYAADFYLWMKSAKDFPADFEFMNSMSSSIEKIYDNVTAGSAEKWWRVKGNFTIPVDLRRYPFDSQRLQIVIEDKQATLSRLRYAADNSSMLEPGISFAGFDLGACHVVIQEHDLPPANEVYSRYVFTVDITRTPFNAFLKTFLPVIFIMLVVMSSFLLGPDKAATRLAAVSSGLVACVMFHLSITNSVPSPGYLTFADKFMVLTYFILLGGFFLNTRLMVLLDKKKDETAAMKLHHATEGIVFIAVPLLYAGLFLTLLF